MTSFVKHVYLRILQCTLNWKFQRMLVLPGGVVVYESCTKWLRKLFFTFAITELASFTHFIWLRSSLVHLFCFLEPATNCLYVIWFWIDSVGIQKYVLVWEPVLREWHCVLEVVPMKTADWYPTLWGSSFDFYLKNLAVCIDHLFQKHGRLSLVSRRCCYQHLSWWKSVMCFLCCVYPLWCMHSLHSTPVLVCHEICMGEIKDSNHCKIMF